MNYTIYKISKGCELYGGCQLTYLIIQNVISIRTFNVKLSSHRTITLYNNFVPFITTSTHDYNPHYFPGKDSNPHNFPGKETCSRYYWYQTSSQIWTPLFSFRCPRYTGMWMWTLIYMNSRINPNLAESQNLPWSTLQFTIWHPTWP